MNVSWSKLLFVVAFIYDGVLGIAYFFFYQAIYDHFGIALPYDVGYIQFPALLLLIFAFLFLRIASDPPGNRNLMPYGMALKVAFVGTILMEKLRPAVVPPSFVALAWIDVAFLVLFVVAWSTVSRAAPAPRL